MLYKQAAEGIGRKPKPKIEAEFSDELKPNALLTLLVVEFLGHKQAAAAPQPPETPAEAAQAEQAAETAERLPQRLLPP
jgi:hypothetical protein